MFTSSSRTPEPQSQIIVVGAVMLLLFPALSWVLSPWLAVRLVSRVCSVSVRARYKQIAVRARRARCYTC